MQFLTFGRDWWGYHIHVYCREIVSEREGERARGGVFDKLWGIEKKGIYIHMLSAYGKEYMIMFLTYML
jgi:hypothetical protein